MLVPILLSRPRTYQFSLFPLVPQHAHVSRGCVGARARSLTQWHTTRPTATATECGCGVPTELRVQTTVPRTHHSVPHSCLAFSRDRSPAGILVSICTIDQPRLLWSSRAR
ncbi:hypothetical protein ALC53_02867 [Atta colombica]|uniref:Uncharacterized protein n=1 Tax=Atta colombica TaxID=520822 RepID=A0A195BQZ6_9HYME|nr:hypothetical protein ALC53_02867 [Atta colombica]